MDALVLYRPVGQKALDLIRASGFTRIPPRLPEEPIFYPVLNEEYATQIARDWNAKHEAERAGYVTRFMIASEYIARHAVHTVGASIHQEYWIPAAELDKFNRSILGPIEIIAEFHG
jgi:hypothetical protein